jgi:hypothetical protein
MARTKPAVAGMGVPEHVGTLRIEEECLELDVAAPGGPAGSGAGSVV